MATKKTTESGKNTAPQSQKPFAFIPTAGMAKAAEAARIRAEEETRRKAEEEEARKKAEAEARKKAEADKKSANAVIKNIDAIGLVQYGKFSKIQIARSSYNALNKEQKKLVDNIDVLIAAEKTYKEFEEAQKKAEDQQKADLVIAQIAAIGVVEYLDACYKKINAARWAYAQLSASQKDLVENIEVLTSAGKNTRP